METQSNPGTPVKLPPGFWNSLWSSATSFPFYRQIKDQTFGRSLRYLLALAACLSLLISVRVGHDFHRSLDEWASWIADNIPEIHIENGIAAIPLGQIRTLRDERAILILDASAEPKPIEEKYRTGLALGKDKMLLKWNQAAGPYAEGSRLEKFIYAICFFAYVSEPQAFHGNQFDLAAVRSLVINAETIRGWKNWAGRWVGISLPFVTGVFYLAGKLLQALFSALVQMAGLQIPHLEWVVLGMYVAFLMGAMGACLPPKPSGAFPSEEETPTDHWADF